jgi:hypothetical protein
MLGICMGKCKPLFHYRETDWKELEKRTRLATKEVIPCDIFKDPVCRHRNQPYDAIITTLCLETTLHDNFEGYKANVKRLVQVLKPGGHLFIVTMLGMPFHDVDGEKVPTQTLTEGQHRMALTDAGLMIKKEALYAASTGDRIEGCETNFTHLHFVLAQNSNSQFTC